MTEATTRGWNTTDIPDLHGRTAVVTGANTGIGWQTAKALAAHGATVVLACRDTEKAADAAARITTEVPAAQVSVLELDLASQASVRRAAEQVRADQPRLDLLINNAGAAVRQYTLTEDGFDKTLATNHLGHFAFTGLVLDRLMAVPGSRVVTVSSVGHKRGTIHFGDLHQRRGFQAAYFQSKLANLLFTYELQRRLADSGAPTIAVAAHPGNARTEFGRDMSLFVRVMMSPRLRLFTSRVMHDPPTAALPTVRAAIDPEVRGGDYYGPDGWNEFTGHPVRVQSSASSHDTAAQIRLWQESERLTGVSYPIQPMHEQRSDTDGTTNGLGRPRR